MGVCSSCRKEQNAKMIYSTRTIINHRDFPSLQLKLTTESLLKFESNCLLIFTDKLEKIKQNEYLLKCGKSEARKIHQFAKSSIQNLEIHSQECLIFKNEVEKLNFQYIAIVGVKLWTGKADMHSQFKQLFAKFLTKTNIKKFESVTILSPAQQLGYPINITSRGILNDLYKMQNEITIRKINILLKNQEYQKYYIESMDKTPRSILDSSFQEKSVKDSNYF